MLQPDPYDQSLIDSMMLLTLWTRAAPEDCAPSIGDRQRLMKLAFLFSHALSEERIEALGLSFFRWRWGATSDGVFRAWTYLSEAGLISEDEQWTVAEDGVKFADDWYRDVLCAEENAPTRAVLDRVAARWRACPDSAPLVDAAYEAVVQPKPSAPPLPVREVGHGDPLLTPANGAASSTLDVDWDFIETLGLMRSSYSQAAISAAEEDFRAGRFSVA